MTTPVIAATGLTKMYGDLVAVNGVSLSVGKGALFGLLGPNGSGKSTMIKMLTGQIRPTAGTATVLGLDVRKDPIGVRERVGIIPEQETPPVFLRQPSTCSSWAQSGRSPTSMNGPRGGSISLILRTKKTCSARISREGPGRS